MMKKLRMCAAAWLAAGMLIAAEGIREFQLGDFDIRAIQDTPMTMPRTLFAAAGRPAPATFPEQFPASVNVFLLRRGNRNILIDAGYGPGRGVLTARLAALGIKPEQIDAVLLTHIHPDHVGGLLDRAGQAAFPKARIYVSAPEYASCNPALAGCLTPYRGRLNVFQFGQSLPEGLVGVEASGHTPGHTVYRLGNLRFAGDVVHAAALQFPHPEYCARYDAVPEQAVRSRRNTLAEAAANHAVLFGAHIPFPGAVTVEAEPGGGFRASAL